MSLPWIKVYTSLPTHHKSYLLEELLDTPMAWAHIVQLWLWSAQQGTNGDLSKYTHRAIAKNAGWTGDPDHFCKAITESGFISEKGLLKNWEKRNGAYERKLKRNKENYKRQKHYATENGINAAENKNSASIMRTRVEESRGEERRTEKKKELSNPVNKNKSISKKAQAGKRSHENLQDLLDDIPKTFNKRENTDRQRLQELLEDQYPSLDIESLAAAAWDHHTAPKSTSRDMAAALKNWLSNQNQWRRPKFKNEKDSQKASNRPHADLKGNPINPPNGYVWRQSDDHARDSGWEWCDKPDSVGSHWRTINAQPQKEQKPEPYTTDFDPPWAQLKERIRKPQCPLGRQEEQQKSKRPNGKEKRSDSPKPKDTRTAHSRSQSD